MKQFITEKSQDKAIVDITTGELTDLHITREVNTDDFIMLFLKSFPQMMDLTGNQLKLLIICWRSCTLNPNNTTEGNIVNNNPYFKNIVRESGLNLSDASINVEMSRLTKKGIIIKRGFGTYMLNPEYFFRGRISDRTNCILDLIKQPK